MLPLYLQIHSIFHLLKFTLVENVEIIELARACNWCKMLMINMLNAPSMYLQLHFRIERVILHVAFNSTTLIHAEKFCSHGDISAQRPSNKLIALHMNTHTHETGDPFLDKMGTPAGNVYTYHIHPHCESETPKGCCFDDTFRHNKQRKRAQ